MWLLGISAQYYIGKEEDVYGQQTKKCKRTDFEREDI